MTKADFELAREKTKEYLEREMKTDHMFYGPASDEYWGAPLRVLAVNMEPYGYQGYTVSVDYNVLNQWLFDAGKTRTRTVRYSITIISALIDAVIKGNTPSEEAMRKAYQSPELLKAVLKKVAYYNIRSTSNSQKRQDSDGIIAAGSGGISGYISDELKALDPHVILVSGSAGLTSFNAMWKLEPRLGFCQRCCVGKTVIQSIKHPSRPSYKECSKIISELAEYLNGTNAA